MNTPLFDPPVSTSNLYAPQIETVKNFISTISFSTANSRSVVEELEQSLCEYHECQYCVTFGTGFWALVAATRVRAISNRSQVIIPSLTYRRLADVVYWAGFTPVLVDIEVDNLSICPDAVQSAITEQTALILAVHPIVNCCKVQPLMKTAAANAIPIVFDAVESVHETYGGKRVGSFGCGEVFSLHASKLINGCEGGYVCTNSDEYYCQLKDIRDRQNCLSNVALSQAAAPPTFDSLNNLHAALALGSLNEIDQNIAHNHKIYQTYASELESLPGISLFKFNEVEQTSYKNVVARIEPGFCLTRDELVASMNQQGMLARPYYSPALHEKSHGFPIKVADMKNTNRFKENLINLPCGQRLEIQDVRVICEYLHQFAGTR